MAGYLKRSDNLRGTLRKRLIYCVFLVQILRRIRQKKNRVREHTGLHGALPPSLSPVVSPFDFVLKAEYHSVAGGVPQPSRKACLERARPPREPQNETDGCVAFFLSGPTRNLIAHNP